MAALTLKSIRLSTLALGVGLALAPRALAADVSVKLDAGSGFSVKNSTGAIERLRVDEATGNLSRNGALFVHTTGTLSTFVGVGAGSLSSTGARNAAFGQDALLSNTTGSYNSAFANEALRANTTGNWGSAVGFRALFSNTTGSENSAFGSFALASNTTASSNSAFGSATLQTNTTGTSNTAIGGAALFGNTTGFNGSAVGVDALRSNTTGVKNSAVGVAALRNNTTGKYNSGFGTYALQSNTTSDRNSGFGYSALRANTTGNRNVGVGYQAGSLQTVGSDNIYLANLGVAAESNTIRIGTPAPGTAAGLHSRAFIAGIRGATTGVADAIPVLIDSAGQLGTVSSSRGVKNDIRDMGDATARLLDLRPVTFRYKQQQTLPSGGEVPPEYGLIAEEVAEVFPDLVVYDEKGQPFTVKYHEMAPMLLNEMKKQQHTIQAQREENQAQQAEIEALRREHQREITALTTRLARVEIRVSGAAGPAQR
jgi:hypothetical protein